MRPLDKLSGVPIETLEVVSAAFRRKLKRAGYATLPEAFDASDGEVDARFGRDYRTVDELEALKRSYEADPVGFVSRAMNKDPRSIRDLDDAIDRRAPIKSTDGASAPRRSRDSRAESGAYHAYVPPVPKDHTGQYLLKFEDHAKASLDALADRGTDYLAFEAFEDFSTDLGELSRCFRDLFRRFTQELPLVYSLVAAHLPNAFVIFCADQVRASYDGENLWGNFFRSLGITRQTAQQKFKLLMVSCLKQRGMPTYGSSESEFYSFYTALLHGGLTKDLWEDLWEKTLLPMARMEDREPYAFGYALDGHKVLEEMRAGRFSPGAAVLSIVNKAPDATMAPFFDAAIGVARRLVKPGAGVTMLTRSGIPDTALDALGELRAPGRILSRGRRGAVANRRHSERRAGDLIYLPEPRLVLDLDEGQACMEWKKSVLPDEYLGDRIDFFVNGMLLRSAEVVRDVHACVIEAGDAMLPPRPGYEVEIKLMHKAQGDTWTEEASLEQAFVRTKPGCLEFLQMPDGTFRLRKRGERITRTRTVAYVIKPGRMVVPGPGMVPRERRFTSEEWGDRTIYLFDIAPGSSGSIVEVETGRELAAWQENVSATVGKTGCIGATDSGLDLYGVSLGRHGNNESLPVVTIEAADGMAALDDMDVILTCDDRRLSVRRRVLQRGDEEAATIVLVLSEVVDFPLFAPRCTLVVRRKSLGITVFTYAFAVVPLGAFAIAGIDPESMDATYTMTAAEPVLVREKEGESHELDTGQCHLLHAPLSDECASLSVESKDGSASVRAALLLAGVSVKVGEEALAISAQRPISFADAFELGIAKGEVSITARSERGRRGALLMLEHRPVLYRDLGRPGTHYANLFYPPELLLNMPDEDHEMKLTLTVFFGDASAPGGGWAELPLLRCREGLGFVRPQVLNTPRGHFLYLGKPAVCDLGAEVFWPSRSGRDERVMFTCEFPRGTEKAELPRELVRQLDAHRKLWIRYYPVTLFGEPERDYALTMPFER